jgi:hypothetical protein
MNKVSKVGTRSKSTVRLAKKQSKEKAARKRMSIAEVEATAVEAAAAAMKSKKLSVSEKVRKLEVVVELLVMAKENVLSRNSEWLLTHVNDPAVNFDPARNPRKKAVSK